MPTSNIGRTPAVIIDTTRRKDLLASLVWCLAWFILITSSSDLIGADPSIWRNDFKSALAEAEEKELPLLVHFYADWCMPCQRMERTTFADQAVREALKTRFVAAKLNMEQNQQIILRYGVTKLPSDLAIDPGTGKVLLLQEDFLEKQRYLDMLKQVETRFRRFHFTKHPPIQETEPDNQEPTSAMLLSNGEAELGEPISVVGLDGFSPVALMKHRKWHRGAAKYSWDYKDVTYQMATREELLEFRDKPEEFAPKLLGCDPVILWETDRAIAGDIQFGAFFDGELYLFKTDERRKQFKANPEKYIRLQHALKLEQVERSVIR